MWGQGAPERTKADPRPLPLLKACAGLHPEGGGAGGWCGSGLGGGWAGDLRELGGGGAGRLCGRFCPDHAGGRLDLWLRCVHLNWGQVQLLPRRFLELPV